MDLSVIVVSHGHDALLSACFDSLAAPLEGLDAELILVDNVASLRLETVIARTPLRVRCVVNARQEGFARNVNRAVAGAAGRYVLLLNPDTVFACGRVADAVHFMETRPDAGALGCRLLNTDGSPQASYRRFPSVGIALSRGFAADRWPYRPEFYRHGVMEGEVVEAGSPVDWVYGAFMLLRRATFLEVGGMDEAFRLYYEDVDLCYRLRQRGLRTYYFPAIGVIHHHLRTSAARPFGRSWRWHVRSMCRYFWKHGYVLRPPMAEAAR
jgi:GT2 family glycosyltransferase